MIFYFIQTIWDENIQLDFQWDLNNPLKHHAKWFKKVKLIYKKEKGLIIVRFELGLNMIQ